MEHLTSLSLGKKLILGAGLLLFIDTFFAWQSVSLKFAGVTAVTAKANAWHGFWGVVLCLMTIAIVLLVAAQIIGAALPPSVPGGLVTLALGGLILLFALLKNLIDDYSAWASYVGIVLAAGVAFGAWLSFQESGEELPRMASAGGGTSAPPPPPPPTYTPPAPPAPPVTEEPTPPADEERM